MENEGFGNKPLNQILQKKLKHIQQIQHCDLQGTRTSFPSKGTIHPNRIRLMGIILIYAYKMPRGMRSSTAARYHQTETAVKYRKRCGILPQKQRLFLLPERI
jgi:hypothetical protein